MKKILLETLITEAFSEKRKTDERQDESIQNIAKKVVDIQKLLKLMDERLDEFIERIKRVEEYLGKTTLNSNTFYETYKNGDEE